MRSIVRDPGLGAKLLGVVLLAALLPAGLTLGALTQRARGEARAAAEALLAARADHIAAELNGFHRRYRALALYLASVSAEELRQGRGDDTRPGFAATAAGLLATGEDVRAALLANPDGRVVASSDPLAVGTDVSFRSYFRRALGGDVVVSDLFLRPSIGEASPLVGYAAPVRGLGGQMLGVAAVFVRAGALYSLARDSKDRTGPGSHAVIYDRHGVRLAHGARDDLRFRAAGPIPEEDIQAMVAESRFGASTRELLESAVPAPHEFQLARRTHLHHEARRLLRVPPVEGGAATYALARRLDEVAWTVFEVVPEAAIYAGVGFERWLGFGLGAGGAGLLFGLLVALLLVRGIGRRIAGVTAATQAIARGELDARAPVGSADELGTLAAELNRAAAALAAQRSESDTRLAERGSALEAAQRELGQKREELLRQRNELESKQRELERKSDEVRSADRLKSEFLANVSHELRTPLNAIIGFSELLLHEAGDRLERRHAQYVEDVLASGRHLLGLINDILDLSKIEAGHVALEREPVDPGDVLAEACELLGPAASKREVTLNHSSRATRPVSADRAKLLQVLLNLLSNAIKFSPPQSRVDVSTDDLGPMIGFTIEDRGPGIDESLRNRLFQPFVQGDGGLGKRHQGTGLGLAICQRLCQQHGGRIELHPRPGGGSSFRVLLPVDTSAPSVPATPGKTGFVRPPTPAPVVGPPRRATILVVDDNDLNRELVRSVLERRGKKVLQARDGEEGVAMALEHAPDLVLMDLAMPRMDGIAATRALRANPATRGIPIIALTALAMRADEAEARAAGVDDYLAKPIDRKRLEETVERLIARRKAAS